MTSLGPALQYLPGTMPVQAGQRCSLVAEHNTVALRYSLRAASYSHLALRDASMPLAQFAMAADGARLRAYGAVLERAVQRRLGAGGCLCSRAGWVQQGGVRLACRTGWGQACMQEARVLMRCL